MKSTATQSNSGMRIIPYTLKSFAVVGDTYAVKETLKAMHGTFSRWLKVDGKHVPGWCFSLKREQQVRKFLMDHGGGSPAPIVAKESQPKASVGKVTIDKLVAKAVAKELAKLKKASEPKAETACSKERIQQALSGESVSPRHWAMRHVLSNGLRPMDVSSGTGLFGRDRDGKAFGETERKSMIWMLRTKAPVIDLALCEDCPVAFRSQVDANTLLDIVTEFSGPGGKIRLVAECCELAHQHAEAVFSQSEFCPF